MCMSFLGLIFRNPFRDKSRALLAIIGIGIGIATIVALGAITDGMIAGADDTLHAGGSDFTITGKESEGMNFGSFGSSSISSDWIDRIENISGVDKAVGIYLGLMTTSKSPYFAVIGMNPEDSQIAEIKIIDGVLYKNNTNEIIIGKLAGEKEDKGVGDTISFAERSFKIVGIYETGDSYQDTGAFTSLDNVQDMMNSKGNITAIYVKVDKGADVEDVTNRVNLTYGKNISTITSLSDVESAQNLIDILNGASTAISLLAIIIGAVGIINTMLTSVFERTRELGVLKAVGWSSNKILLMIIGESIVLTLVSGVFGSIAGIIGVELLASTNLMTAMTPVFTIKTFVYAFSVALIVGIIGGIYPAYKATKLPPTEALRYE